MSVRKQYNAMQYGARTYHKTNMNVNIVYLLFLCFISLGPVVEETNTI